MKSGESPPLGLDDDQLRLLLVSAGSGAGKIRATWRGKPAAGIDVRTFIGDESNDAKTDAAGELPCPEVGKAGVSLLAQFRDSKPGSLGGKRFTHTRYKATLNLFPPPHHEADAAIGDELNLVKEIHGTAGLWAVTGYRIGERALKELGLPRHSFSLLVEHECPAQIQYSCIADGLQAATGASPGKLNLTVKEANADAMRTVVSDRQTGRRLVFTLRPEFAASIRDLPSGHFGEAVRRIVDLPDDKIFNVSETAGRAK